MAAAKADCERQNEGFECEARAYLASSCDR
jgi:hypothetical protein